MKRRKPTYTELMAWALYRAMEEQAFESPAELHEEMMRLESIPEWRLHAELYLDLEEFREEFLPPAGELLSRLAKRGDA